MAGGALAALLADTGLRVRVLDGAPEPRAPDSEPELRVSALNEASHWLLRSVGAWQRLPHERVCAYTDMAVRDGDGTGEVDFQAHEAGAEQLGWILENAALVCALYDSCAERDQVQWETGVRVMALELEHEGWRAELGDGSVRRGRLLIGADGANSRVRAAAGIPAPVRDSGHHALVATLHTDIPHGNCARQVFLDQGPLALLPLFGDGHQCSLVWSAPPDEIARLAALDDDGFARELTTATGGWLGRLSMASYRTHFPIRELHTSDYHRPGLALIGDAAHVVHPLAGQGINLGLLDAGVLAEEIERARSRGLAFDHEAVLRRYQRRRRGHNALMQNALRGFQFAFEQRAPAVRWVRNTGMHGLNQMPPLKGVLARQALGRNGDLPQRARAGVMARKEQSPSA
jgi:2-octaprenylphenol hydroxylase